METFVKKLSSIQDWAVVVQVIQYTKLLADEWINIKDLILHYENMIYLKFCTIISIKNG
jgi:hypothetical protein